MPRITVTASLFVHAPLAALVVACATPGADPTDMTTTGHEDAAKEHANEAAEHEAQFDPEARATKRVLVGTGIDFLCPAGASGAGVGARCYDFEQYNPTAHHLRSAERQEKMARDHAKAAVALEQYEEGACKLFEPRARESCPLLGQLERVDRLPNGVRLTPKAGVNVDAWQAHVACHLAFAQARGAGEMTMCPLGQREVAAVAVGDVIELTSDDADVAAQLMALAQKHVE